LFSENADHQLDEILEVLVQPTEISHLNISRGERLSKVLQIICQVMQYLMEVVDVKNSQQFKDYK